MSLDAPARHGPLPAQLAARPRMRTTRRCPRTPSRRPSGGGSPKRGQRQQRERYFQQLRAEAESTFDAPVPARAPALAQVMCLLLHLLLLPAPGGLASAERSTPCAEHIWACTGGVGRPVGRRCGAGGVRGPVVPCIRCLERWKQYPKELCKEAKKSRHVCERCFRQHKAH